MSKKTLPLRLTLLSIFYVSACIGCSSVTVKPNGGLRLDSPANYVDSKPFYLGIIGQHKVDVNEACEGGEVLQMQSIISANDFLLSLMTLFIYTPRTAKVWCSHE